MANSFTIPKRAYEGLSDLIDLGPNRLDRLAEEVSRRALTLDVEALAADLAGVLEFDPSQLERTISNVLIPLSGIRADFRMDPGDFLQLLSETIERQNTEWHKTNHAKWSEVAPTVGQLIAADSYFRQLHKAYNLLTNRPTLVREFKVLTELRPVYDDEVTATKAFLLTSTLVIDYDDGGEAKQIHLTVGQQELGELQEQLDRAEKKVQLLEEQADRLGVPVLVVGN